MRRIADLILLNWEPEQRRSGDISRGSRGAVADLHEADVVTVRRGGGDGAKLRTVSLTGLGRSDQQKDGSCNG